MNSKKARIKLAETFIFINSCASRFYIYLLVICYLPLAHADNNVQIQTLWKLGDQKLADDGQTLSIQLEKAKIGVEDQAVNSRLNTIPISLNAQNNNLQYQTFQINTEDQADIKQLKDILVDYVKHLYSARNKEAHGISDIDQDTTPTITTYTNSNDAYNVNFDFGFYENASFDQDPYGGTVRLISTDGKDPQYIIINEPTALLYTLYSMSDIQQRLKQEIEALANKKEAEAETAKKAKELEEQKAKEQKDETDAEANKELAKKEAAISFMNSNEGQALLTKIQTQWKARTAEYEQEAPDIVELQKELNQLFKNSVDLSLPEDIRSESGKALPDMEIQLGIAKRKFVPSDKLKQMTADLKASFDEFQAKAGVSYDDAMKYQQKQSS